MPIPNAMGGGQLRPTAQEMAGGIPQNADPGKMRPLSGRPMQGGAPPPSFAPPPVQGASAPMDAPPPAQLMPQQAPMAVSAAPPMPPMGGGMGGPPGGMPMGGPPQGMGGPPPGGANPQMLQALMARMQAQGGAR